MKILASLLSLSMIAGCASLGVTSKGKNAEYSMVKPNIRIDKYKDTWNMRGEGPVKDCGGKACTDADIDTLKPDQIKALKKHGQWKEYAEKEDESKKKIAVLDQTGNYVDGQKDGVWTKLGEKGEKLRETTYKLGKKDGVEKKYNLKGEQTEEINYVDNKKNGKYWKKTSKGLMESEGQFKDDLRDGTWTEYHAKEADMVKKNVSEYSKDKKNGKSTSFHKDGSTVSAEGLYKEGLKSGPWKNYYDNGKPESEGSYAPREAPKDKGEKDAPKPADAKPASPSGDVAGPEPEKKAFRMGLWKEYYKNGQLFAEGPREHTRKGEWKFYDNAGKLRFKGKMANEAGMESAEVYDDKTGEIIGKGKLFFSLIKIDEETQNIKAGFKPSNPYTYYKNGKKDFDVLGEDKEGNVIGIQYDESGKEAGRGPVIAMNRKKNGCWTEGGKKVYYVMDKPNAKMGDMQGCR